MNKTGNKYKLRKMNKKAWLRIVEAFLAILIVISAVLIIVSKTQTRVDISGDVNYKQRQVLDIVAKDDNLRERVIQGDSEYLNSRISSIIPQNWNFTTKICSIEDICNADTPLDREVYVSQIIITSSVNEYNPKKVKFFVWAK